MKHGTIIYVYIKREPRREIEKGKKDVIADKHL